MSRQNLELFELYRVSIPVDAIKALPSKARRVYHLAGNIANEINELHRLAILSIDQGNLPAPLEQVTVARGWVILRVLMGKTYEAIQFIEEHLREAGEFYNDYLREPLTDVANHPYLDRNHREAYGKVWRRISERRGLLYAIRNKISFHYKLLPYLDQGFEGLDESWDQSLYSAGSMRHQARHASYNAGAEAVIVRAMLQKVIETGELGSDPNPNLVRAIEVLADETTDSAGEIADLMETLILCVLEKHQVTNTMRGTAIMDLTRVPSIRKFRIPPFLRSD